MSTDARPPRLEAATMRIRVEHSRTQRDGWGYSTTVELDGIAVGDPGYAFDEIAVDDATALIKSALAKARDLGETERDIRNQRDNAAKEAAAQNAITAS